MANFVKCKEEFVTYKRMKDEEGKPEIKRVFLWFKKKFLTYILVPDEDGKHVNNPINLTMVLDIEKTKGAPDIMKGDPYYKNYKPGIKFDFGKYSSWWFYSDEKMRDLQFEEISNNTHIYKSKVLL